MRGEIGGEDTGSESGDGENVKGGTKRDSLAGIHTTVDKDNADFLKAYCECLTNII